MKKIILILSLLSVHSFASSSSYFVVTGNSGQTIGPQEVCNYRKIVSRAIEDANTKCNYFYSWNSNAVDFIITEEWEARVPHCGRDGECGYRHECILSWRAKCEKKLKYRFTRIL